MVNGRGRHVFIGPSVPDAAAIASGTGLRLHPPVAAGDLLRLPLAEGDIVGIVDGYFHQVRSVRHKEILSLLARGIVVLGAASIGALRAAELERFGMRGVGEIFADYRDGRLEADDEVALMHGSAESGYFPMSEPLVNIRATLALAEHGQICDSGTASRIVSELAARPFHQRSYAEVVLAARMIGLDAVDADRLGAFCAANGVNRKRGDALKLMTLVSSLCHTGSPLPSQFSLNRSLHLHGWELAADYHSIAALRACQVFASNYPTFYRGLVLGWLADDCARECKHTISRRPLDDVQELAIAHGEHRGLYNLSDGDYRFLDPWMTRTDNELSRNDRIARFLVRTFRIGPGIVDDRIQINPLRQGPALQRGSELAELATNLNGRAEHIRAGFHPSRIADSEVVDWLMQLWECSPGELEFAGLDRGLESITSVLTAASDLYLLGVGATRRDIALDV